MLAETPCTQGGSLAHVTLDKPLTLEIWQEIMQETFPGAKFRDYGAVFEVPQPCTIAARLKEILEEFAQSGRGAVFSIWGHDVAGFWVDPFHNYLGIAFSNAKGDDFDGVLVNSIGGS
jgi:hypothetical protein